MFGRRKRRRAWETARNSAFVTAMVVADYCAMGYLPSVEAIDAYREAERKLRQTPRPR